MAGGLAIGGAYRHGGGAAGEPGWSGGTPATGGARPETRTHDGGSART
jgi:hypothetical protein